MNEWRGYPNKDVYLPRYNGVSFFSGRNLTYKKDRLPAISGLAAEVVRVTGDTYLAGIWERDLLAGLSWRIYLGVDASFDVRSVTYRAPSWSWASVDSKVEYFGPPKGFTREEMAHTLWKGTYLSSTLAASMAPEILEAIAQSSGLDSLGSFSSAHISMNCIGIPASVVPDPRSPELQKDHKVIVVV
jgi:hypothetical protein